MAADRHRPPRRDLCNLPLPDDLGEIHADHIHPVSKGGETSPENTAALHAACNIAKGAKLVA